MWTIYYVLKRPGPHLVAPHEACARRAVQHARQFLRDRERQSVLAAPLRVGDGRCRVTFVNNHLVCHPCIKEFQSVL